MIYPPFLKPGDKIGVIAPAGPITYPDDIQAGLELLSNWGLTIEEGRTPSLHHFQFSGTDQERLSDLQYMFDQPEIKAVIAVRGGYGTSRIIDGIDFSGFKQSPKWLIGFSDITLLLCHLEKLGYASIHGPMVKQIGTSETEVASTCLCDVLFGTPVRYEMEHHPFNRPGVVKESLVGGNLCLLAHSIGSVSEVETANKILFLEDVGEQLYNLDRMLWQLQRAGKLKDLAGLMVGQFTELKGTAEAFGQDAYDIVLDHVKYHSYPVAFGLPVGHVADNRPLIIGKQTKLEVGPNGATVEF